MPKLTKLLLSPLALFFIFTVLSMAAIMGFRFLFPGVAVPLPPFAVQWRLIRGVLTFLHLFPALALTSLVIPFALTIRPREIINPFSPKYFEALKMPIVTAIVAALCYSILFLLVLPLAQNHEANLRYKGRLYVSSVGQAREHAVHGEWAEAVQLLSISQSIWPGDTEAAWLKAEAEVNLIRTAPPVHENLSLSAPGNESVDVIRTLVLAETALREERFFDAHWLASLALRFAQAGSPEAAHARQLSSFAWDGINSLQPTNQQSRAFANFRLKRDGYEALNGGEWIRAYYIFVELLTRTPEDPDVHRFFAMSRDGITNIAFFADEMNLSLGRTQEQALFSFPFENGRLVVRFSSFAALSDSAYGTDAEIHAFDHNGRQLWIINSPYAKILPLAVNPRLSASAPQLTVLVRALDRSNADQRWEPEIQNLAGAAPENAQLALSISWDDFLLLASVRRGLSTLTPAELIHAANTFAPYGYEPKVFQLQLIQRFTEPFFLLPLGILVIVLGWRYRAMKRPRYMGILMLGVMPALFNVILSLLRLLLANIGLWTIIALGFTAAAIAFGVGLLLLLVLFLILLASQHG